MIMWYNLLKLHFNSFLDWLDESKLLKNVRKINIWREEIPKAKLIFKKI